MITALLSAGREVQNALQGAFRLACLDPGGLDCFDRSPVGLWRSFRAILLCYPLFLIFLGAQLAGAGEDVDAVRTVIVDTIAYVIGWVAFPLALVPICDRLGRGEHYIDLVVAYNWSQILQYGYSLFILGLVVGTGIDDTIASLPMYLYEWYIVRVALEIGAMPAALIVLFDFALSMSVGIVADLMS
jgi:hypothetical protein